MKDLIDLQNAHVTQFTNETSGKSAWKVRKNITNEDLFDLPKDLCEKDVFTILDFAKKFELIAFNKGINFQKEQSNKIINQQRQEFDTRITLARQENERLANKLGQLIGEQE